jgi:hypothetical protein
VPSTSPPRCGRPPDLATLRRRGRESKRAQAASPQIDNRTLVRGVGVGMVAVDRAPNHRRSDA